MNRFWRWMKNQAKSDRARRVVRAIQRPLQRRSRRLQLESLDARRVLASAYQNPGQVFDVNNDTYVDQEDIRLSEVRLATKGEGQLPATRDHHLIPFYDVNGDGAFTKQDIADLRKQILQGPATTSFKLDHDSGNKLDRTTNDVRIVGRVMNFDPQTRVFAWFGNGRWSQVDVTNLVARDGSFHFSIHDLHRINGRIFADGAQTMFMQSYNRQGRTSGVVDYGFTIDRNGPAAFSLLPMDVQAQLGSQPPHWIARWTQVDARSYDLRITSDAAGKNIVLYKHDLNEHDYNSQFWTKDLPAGTYYIWLTGFDRSGNRTEATGSGMQATWTPSAYMTPVVTPPVVTPPITIPPVTTPPVTNPPIVTPPIIVSPPVVTPPVVNPPVVPPPVILPPPEQVAPTVNPTKMETIVNGGLTTYTWKATVTASGHLPTYYWVEVSRDPYGADKVIFTTLHDQQREISLSHLPSGKYYITIREGVRSDDVRVVDTLEVDWDSHRSEDFSIERPGFVIGDSLDLKWDALAGATSYTVRLYKTDMPKAFWAGIDVFTGNMTRDQWAERYRYAYNTFVGDFETTTNLLHLGDMEDGQYTVEVIAKDANGVQTLSGNIAEFTIDQDGKVQWASKEVGRGGDHVSIWASPALSAVARTRFEVYTSPDFSPESLMKTIDSPDRAQWEDSWEALKAHPALYIKVSYFDYKGVRISLDETWKIVPADIRQNYAKTNPIYVIPEGTPAGLVDASRLPTRAYFAAE